MSTLIFYSSIATACGMKCVKPYDVIVIKSSIVYKL